MSAQTTNNLYEVKAVGEILRRQAEIGPDAAAIHCEGRTMTYATLHANAMESAARIAAAMPGSGHRVAFIGRECEAYYEVLFGCAIAGAVFVPINWKLTSREVAHIIADAGVSLIFCGPETRQVVADSLRDAAHAAEVVCLHEGEATRAHPSPRREAAPLHAYADPDPERTFCLIYTSGTTGLPKGVCLPHKSFFQIREALIHHGLTWLDWRPEDSSLVGIPGFHIGGLWWALQSFSAGAAIVLLPVFDPKLCLEAMQRHRVSIACMVPAMINLLLDVVEHEDARIPELRKLVYGGAPISKALLQRGISILGCEFAQIYGLSETGNTAVCLDPASHQGAEDLLRAAGRPYPGVALKVVDQNGEPLAPGEVGEVCILSPANMTGYWQQPGATAAALRDGWLHTGDAGYINEAGYLFICDRIKDVIITGGEKIFPVEIENVVAAFPMIHECAAIGIPDPLWGERVICLLVAKTGKTIDQTELYRYLETRLAPYKIPAQMHLVEGLPRNPSGKLLRRSLREAFWAGRERMV
jgi:long-chain acyl-CoA synthetase